MRTISKRDIFGGKMTGTKFAAGRSMEQRMLGAHEDPEQHGMLQASSMDAEAMAPKTWILWRDGPDMPNGMGKPVIEAELYQVPRASDARETIGMVVLMCPVCFMHHKDEAGNPYEHYLSVREDNKTLHLDFIEYRKLKPGGPLDHLRINYEFICRERGIRPEPEDKIPMVGSPERWMCDYCQAFCVRVTDSIAVNDWSGAQITVAMPGERPGPKIIL